jgi:hypothetical protein
MADKWANHRSILLFDVALVILALWTASGEGEVFSLTISEDDFVDKLFPVVGINAQDRERKEGSCLQKSGLNHFWTAVEQWETFGSSRSDVGESQGIQKASLRLPSAMSNQIGFQKTRLRFIPLLEGADGDLVFEQRASFRRRKTLRSGLALCVQQAISGGRTHPHEVVPALFAQMEVAMALQCVNERG